MANYTQKFVYDSSCGTDTAAVNTVFQTLVTNGIVGAVEYSVTSTWISYATFVFYEDQEKTKEFFRIQQSQGRNPSSPYFHKMWTYTATGSDGSTFTTNDPSAGSGAGSIDAYWYRYAYSCENGVLIGVNASHVDNFTGTPIYWILITSNNNGKPVAVWCESTSNEYAPSRVATDMNTEYVICSSDVAPLNSVTRHTPQDRNQTVVSPFFTNSGSGEISYTPNAGRLLACNFHDFILTEKAHEIIMDGNIYLTNGYWVLKVGSV